MRMCIKPSVKKYFPWGKTSFPTSKAFWENISNEETQERIEHLIHRVHFRDLTREFCDWKDGEAGLLEGAIIIAKYHYPDLNAAVIRQEIEKIRRNTWLELNNYLPRWSA